MRKIAGFAGALALSLGSLGAQADVIISGIDMEVRESNYVVQNSDAFGDLYSEFLTGDLVCDVSLDALENVGSVQTCGGPNRDIATLFSTDFALTGNMVFEFGVDWGNGSAFLLDPFGFEVTRTDDMWWNYDFDNESELWIVSFSGFTGQALTMNFLGFEGCCGGAMSARYSLDNGRTWQTYAVNVPEPGTLALLGLGLIGIGAARRRKV